MAKAFLKTVNMAKAKTKKVKILNPVGCKYKLSANVNEVVAYPIALADELVENKDAEFVK